MLRGSLLAAALLALLGFGSATGHVPPDRIAYVHLGNGNRLQIYSMTSTGAGRHPLTTGNRYSSYEPAYSPRGDRILFVRAFKQDDLWTMRSDGSRKRRLTRTRQIWEQAPAWSPNGSEIVFEVDEPASLQGIWIARRSGSGRTRLTTGADTHPSWSSAGSEIAFARGGAIYEVSASGGAPTQLSFPGADSEGMPYEDLEPAWSPDGARILFVSDRGDPAESVDELDLWVMNADGSDVRRVTNTPSRDERDPAWSPDGRHIVYSGSGAFHGASSSQLYVSHANGSDRRKLTHACGECAWINDDPSWQRLPG